MTVSENVSFVSNLEINVEPGQTQSQTTDRTKSFTWSESEYTIKNAVMTIEGPQTYFTGAELHVALNDQDVSVLHWNFGETGDKKATMDVTSLLDNGDNKLSIYYKLAAPALTEQIATVNVSLSLEFIGQNVSGKPPVNEGNVKNGNFWRDLGKSLKSWIWIIIVLAVVAIVIYVILRSVLKLGPGGSIVNQVKTIIDSIRR